MKHSKNETKDPICGMTVDETISLSIARDGKTHYFCGETCRKKFLSVPPQRKPVVNSQGCCG
jgi:YHS domain-containing protein